MCGIAGFLALPSDDRQQGNAVLERMGAALRHRGPDGGSCWNDPAAGIGLVHRRLAILDLSEAGLQPMHSADGRFVLSYNGEIYNHSALRRRLEAEGMLKGPWRGASDTETLLAAIDAWGVERALSEIAGMFAFAVWDRQECRLWLARDRMGEKPLYYGIQRNTLMFGSELKAIRLHPDFIGELNPASVDAMIRRGYVPGPSSIYRGIYKLPPGSLVTIDASSSGWRSELPEARHYWSPVSSFAAARTDGAASDAATMTVELEQLLSATIADQMVADVPLGSFLSGGIDSTLVTALMQAQQSKPVRTFTIGFDEEQMNEAHAAKAIARHLGTEHTEFYVTATASLDVIPRLPDIYDEPFADASQIPTHIMCTLARKHVTVALSGDGGDELFGGYNRHLVATQLTNRMMSFPAPMRRVLGAALLALPRASVASLASRMQRRTGGIDLAQMVRKLEKVAAVLNAPDQAGLYDAFVEHTTPYGSLTNVAKRTAENNPLAGICDDDPSQAFMLRDMLCYLPDDVLVKVDRAAMAASLETRAPFLDHRVVEYSHRLRPGMKIRDGKGKVILRDILTRHVPADLFERPKMGFSVPIDTWLRGPLREWTEALLSPDKLAATGMLNSHAIGKLWQEHRTGARNWAVQLWSVLMLQAWLEANGNVPVTGDARQLAHV